MQVIEVHFIKLELPWEDLLAVRATRVTDNLCSSFYDETLEYNCICQILSNDFSLQILLRHAKIFLKLKFKKS